jgi:hypothetical protein
VNSNAAICSGFWGIAGGEFELVRQSLDGQPSTANCLGAAVRNDRECGGGPHHPQLAVADASPRQSDAAPPGAQAPPGDQQADLRNWQNQLLAYSGKLPAAAQGDLLKVSISNAPGRLQI